MNLANISSIFQDSHCPQEYQYDFKLVLQHVFKPHTGEVSAMIVDDEGSTLVTTSAEDKTVFFFDIKSSYMPVGFIKLEAAPTTMAWSNESVILDLGEQWIDIDIIWLGTWERDKGLVLGN